jgi:hypothetical protein
MTPYLYSIPLRTHRNSGLLWKVDTGAVSCKLQIIVEFRNQRAEGVTSHGSTGNDAPSLEPVKGRFPFCR